jgi:hypothetical protein
MIPNAQVLTQGISSTVLFVRWIEDTSHGFKQYSRDKDIAR